MSVTSTKNLLYILADSEGLSYEWDGRRAVKDVNPTWVDKTPNGWTQNGISFVRNTTYWGINRSFIGDLKFTGTAASIIRYLFYSEKGIDQDLYLLVLKWNDENGTYEIYYRGQLDLTTFQDQAFEGVQVAIIEGGILKFLKANENTPYQFPLDGTIPENKPLNLDGYSFLDTFLYQTVQMSGLTAIVNVPITFVKNSGDNIGIIKGDQSNEELTTDLNTFINTSSNTGFEVTNATQLQITGTFSLHMDSVAPDFPNGGRVTLKFYTKSQTVTIFDQNANTGDLLLATFGTNNPMIINMAAGEKLFLILIGTATAFYTLNQTQFNIEFSSRFQTTQAWCIPIPDLFRLLVQQMTGFKYSSVSTLLDKYSNLVVTSGDALRYWSYVPSPAIPNPKVVLKTTFKDFWDSFGNVLFAALSSEMIDGMDTLFFEDRSFVFDSSKVTMNAGEVSGIKVSAANDYVFTDFKCGYPEQQYDQQSGKQEFNTTHTYKLPFQNLAQKEFNAISKYRADSFGIEFTRFDQSKGNSITNNSSDNAVFIVNTDTSLSSQIFYAQKRGNTQILSPEADAIFDELDGNGVNVLLDNTKTKLTYKGPQQKVRINSTFDTQGGSIQMQIRVNGVMIDSLVGTGLLSKTTITILNPSAILTIHLLKIDGGPCSVLSGTVSITLSKILLYQLKRANYSAISGIDNPSTAFNIEDLSPKRIFLRWGAWLRSILHNRINDIITYQVSDKNQLLSTTLNNVTIQENADVGVGGLPQPLFYPLVVDFKTLVPVDFATLLNGAANGHIQFSYNGKIFYGFPLEVKQTPALNEAQEWKVLISPKTNIKDLIDLDIDGLEHLNLTGMPLFPAHLNPTKIVPLNQILPAQYHYRDMDNWWFKEQTQFFLSKKNYFQKWQQTDVIPLQCLTNGLGPVQVQLIDVQGNMIKQVQLIQTADPAVQTPNILYQGSMTLNDVDEGQYYMYWVAGTGDTKAQGISEGIWVKQDWPYTVYIEYSNSKNKQATIFSKGWIGAIRVEGWLWDFVPGANAVGYEDQPADFVITNGVPYRKHTLHIGSHFELVPPWIIDKLNRIFLLDNVKVEGIPMARSGQDAQFEPVEVQGYPSKLWSMEVREAEVNDGVAIQAQTGGVLDDNLTVTYQINTKGFGDGSNGDNVVEITKLE